MRLKKLCSLLLSALLLLSAAPAALAAPGEQPYVHEERFGQDVTLTGLFSSYSKLFQTGDWDIHSVDLMLSFNATQLVDLQLSSITISINGLSFYSGRVPVNTGEKQLWTLSVPVHAIKPGSNEIKIDGYIRTDGSLPCVDDVSHANWLNIFKESMVSVVYAPRNPVSNIAEFFQKFTSIEAMDYMQSGAFVRPGASNEELTAAGLVLSGISKSAVMNYNNLYFGPAWSIAETGDVPYAIYISSLAALPSELGALLSAEQLAAAQESAVMALVTSGDKTLLILTGADPAALITAGRLAGNATALEQLLVTSKQIFADDDVLVRREDTTQYAQLTEKEVHGLFRQEAQYQIPFYKNKTLAVGSEVYLKIRYSKNIDFERSLLTVYINDRPIGSHKLTLEKADDDEVTLQIPADIDVTGTITLRVCFDLEQKDTWCNLRMFDSPWAFITKESMVKINSTDVPYVLFDYYPSPLVTDGALNQLTVVMPEAAVRADYEAVGMILLTLGRYLETNKGDLHFVSADQPGQLQDRNIITIGSYQKNSFTRSLKDQLFFRFSEDGSRIVSNEKLILMPEYGAALGTGQYLRSPDSQSNFAVAVITGTTDEAMLYAAWQLGSEEQLWSVTGDGFVTDGEKASMYRFKEENAKKPAFTKRYGAQADMGVWVLSLALLGLLIALTAILLFLRYKKKGGRHEK